jgi:hypothetical protein
MGLPFHEDHSTLFVIARTPTGTEELPVTKLSHASPKNSDQLAKYVFSSHSSFSDYPTQPSNELDPYFFEFVRAFRGRPGRV